MSALLLRLLQQLLYDSRITRSDPAGGWECLELDSECAVDPARLGLARELVVRQPAALTLDVLAAAPRLAAVVLPTAARLPSAVLAELAHRQIATIWQARPGQSGHRAPRAPGTGHQPGSLP